MSNTQNQDLDQILLLDDDPNTISFIKKELEDQGYHIITVSDIDTAKGHLLSGDIKVVLFGETKEIKDEYKKQALQSLGNGYSKGTSIILMARYDDPYASVLEAHADALVERPDARTMDQLIESVNKHCKTQTKHSPQILIADKKEDSLFQEFSCKLLDNKGYHTDVVLEAKEVQERAVSGNYALIFLDATHAEVLSHPELKTSVVITGYFSEVDVSGLKNRNNVVGFLFKSNLDLTKLCKYTKKYAPIAK